jgi:hypothetical protein
MIENSQGYLSARTESKSKCIGGKDGAQIIPKKK